jgi:glyoxylase-like metal-dependent hydrolase (beta-lactamase superfamily II)
VTPSLRSLGQGLSVLQGPLWQTNATLLEARGDVVLVDPAQFPDELAVLRAAVDRLHPERLWLLITHADFDHVQGIPIFPDGTVVAEALTAERLVDGRAAEGLRGAGRDFGADWDDSLRADRVIGFDAPERLGELELVAIDAAGHQDHGSAFAFPELGVLAAGDYLSAITYPFCIHGVAEARASTERLLAAIEQHAIGTVIPGHGPVHDRATATRIGSEDVRYLAALEAAAAEAAAKELPPAFALLHVFGVEPPRANTDDFEMYDLRGCNARTALRAVGITA